MEDGLFGVYFTMEEDLMVVSPWNHLYLLTVEVETPTAAAISEGV